jgi:hypothetical protein
MPLKDQLNLNFSLNEPEALIAILLRRCAEKAEEGAKGWITAEEAKRWSIVANALTKAEIEVAAANSPEARKFISPEGVKAIQTAGTGPPVRVLPDGSCEPTQWPPAGLKPSTLETSAQQEPPEPPAAA